MFIRVLVVLILVAWVGGRAFAESGDKNEILRRHIEKIGPAPGSSYQARMVMIDITDGREERSEIDLFILDRGRVMVRFLSPTRLKNNRFLKIEQNAWLYTDKLKRPIRISASQRMFGEAAIAEVAGIDYTDYRVDALETNADSYSFRLSAKERTMPYQVAQLWISRQTGLPTRTVLKSLSKMPMKEVVYARHVRFDEYLVPEMIIRNLLQNTNRTTHIIPKGIRSRRLPEGMFQPEMMDEFERIVR